MRPIGGGWERFAWLKQGASYASIQAALNDAKYIGVYLEPGATAYNITADLTIPNNKYLYGGGLDPNPAGTRAILNLSAGFRILTQRGTISYLNIVWTAGSALPAVVSAGGTAEQIHVTTSAGTTSIYAFSGSFKKIDRCSSVGMSGINITGNPTTAGAAWTTITNYNSTGSIAGANGLYIANGIGVTNVLIDGFRISGADYGLNISGGDNIHIRDCYFDSTLQYGIFAANANYLDIRGLTFNASAGTSSLYVASCLYVKIANVLSYTPTAPQPVSIIGVDVIAVSNVEIKTATARAFNVQNTNYGVFTDITINGFTAVGATAAFTVDTVHTCSFSNVNVYNATVASYAVYINAATLTNFSNLVVRKSTQSGVFIVGCIACTFNNFTVYDIDGNYGYYINTCNRNVFSNFSSYDTASRGFTLNTNTNCSFAGFIANTGTGVGGIDVIVATGCVFSNLRATAMAGGAAYGISIVGATKCSINGLAGDTNAGAGVILDQLTQSTVTGVTASTNGTDGIRITTCTQNCAFSNFSAYDNGDNGIEITDCTSCTFGNFCTSLNSTNGVLETLCDFCNFNNITAYGEGRNGIEAGGGSTYCHWHSISSSLNAALGPNGIGFNGVACTSCLCDGLMTRANTTASAYAAGWTNINQTLF